MERVKNLNTFQKIVLILLAVMLLCFTVVYPIVSSRVGYEYKDSILLPSEENGSTVYAGKIDGRQAVFTVSPENSVTFQYGDKQYGPYTATEDPSAIPEGREYMTGVELRENDVIIFRGGVVSSGDSLLLIDENDELYGFTVTYTTGDGVVRNADGTPADVYEPSAGTILELMDGPEMTSRGEWLFWFYGLVISVVAAVSILFADELFRWNLSFSIRNADRAEPSELEIASRYFAWMLFPILALICFIVGLKV